MMKAVKILTLLAILPIYSFAQSTASKAPDKKGYLSSLDQCYQQIGSQPRSLIAGCLRQHLQQADKILQQRYGQLQQTYQQTDSSSKQAAIDGLQQSIKAFDHFRQTECQRIGEAAMGGSGAGDFQLACQVDLTRWRILWLKNNS